MAYVLLTTLPFSAAHWEQGIQGLLGSALVGVAAAFAFLRFRQLLPLMLAHAAVDLYLL
jgi:membrane protease YdiL (CAAX protease family)